MKKTIPIVIVVLLLILIISVSSKPLIIFIAKKQLRNIFVNSEVAIGNSALKPMSEICLSNIKIKNGKVYELKIGKVAVSYKLFSVIRGDIAQVFLKDIFMNVNLGQKSTKELKNYLHSGSKAIFLVNRLELENLNLNLISKELSLACSLSAGLKMQTQSVHYLDFKIDSLETQDFRLEKASLKIDRSLKTQNLFIKNIQYDKLKISGIKSSAELNLHSLSLPSLYAEILGGSVSGNIELAMNTSLKYSANLNFTDLDTDRFVKDFNLEEKFLLSGKVNGAVTLSGESSNIKTLSGNFTNSGSGGLLVIKDSRFLENLARNSGQSLDILVESFKNYYYNTGIMRLFSDNRNLILDVALEGEAGKRNLSIVLHDFKLRKGDL